MKKVKSYSKRALSLSLAAMSMVSPNLTSLTVQAEESQNTESQANAASGDTLVQMHVQNDYTVQVPAGINLTYNENGTERPLYDAEYDIIFKGHGNGKTLAVETDDVNLENSHDKYFVTNYLGDRKDASHIAIGTKDFSEEGETIPGYASMGADNVKQGNYEGTAEFKYFMVDTGTKVSDLKNFFKLDAASLAMGSNASHQLNAVDNDGNNINEKVNFTSSNEKVATVTDSGLILTSANATAGSEVTITASLSGDGNVDTASVLESMSKLGALTVEAAEDDTFTASVTVTIVDIDFMDDEDGIDSVEIFPGENKSVRAIIRPETADIVSWSCTRAAGVALQKNGNDCTINLANDMPEGASFEVIATYGDYSKKLTVTAKSRHTHSPAEAVRENNVASTCEGEGSYDSVIYCSDCSDEMLRTHVSVDPKGHHAGEAVRENEVATTCTVAGSYDEVIYCEDCGDELSRNKVTVPATGHTAAAAVIKNRVEPTHTKDGSYDEVVYCSDCHEELSRKTVKLSATGHNPAAAVIENKVAATCEAEGSYDEVVYCTDDHAEISRKTVKTAATGHTWGAYKDVNGEPVRECSSCHKTEKLSWTKEEETMLTVSNRADIGYTDDTTNLNIPKYYIKDDVKYTITSIGKVITGGQNFRTFSKCENLKSVTIPNSVTLIGDNAFSGCTNLASITIPNSVTRIASFAFLNCTSLTSVTIPDSVRVIDDQAFWACSNLTSVTIPDSVTSIGYHAFYECTNLKSITYRGVRYTDKNTFNAKLKADRITSEVVWL